MKGRSEVEWAEPLETFKPDDATIQAMPILQLFRFLEVD